MEPHVHYRDKGTPTAAVCGAGYPWPSSIALTDDAARVTCPQCRRRIEG